MLIPLLVVGVVLVVCLNAWTKLIRGAGESVGSFTEWMNAAARRAGDRHGEALRQRAEAKRKP